MAWPIVAFLVILWLLGIIPFNVMTSLAHIAVTIVVVIMLIKIILDNKVA